MSEQIDRKTATAEELLLAILEALETNGQTLEEIRQELNEAAKREIGCK